MFGGVCREGDGCWPQPPLAALAQHKWREGMWCFLVRFLLSAQGKFLFFGCVSAKKKIKTETGWGGGAGKLDETEYRNRAAFIGSIQGAVAEM